MLAKTNTFNALFKKLLENIVKLMCKIRLQKLKSFKAI